MKCETKMLLIAIKSEISQINCRANVAIIIIFVFVIIFGGTFWSGKSLWISIMASSLMINDEIMSCQLYVVVIVVRSFHLIVHDEGVRHALRVHLHAVRGGRATWAVYCPELGLAIESTDDSRRIFCV